MQPVVSLGVYNDEWSFSIKRVALRNEEVPATANDR